MFRPSRVWCVGRGVPPGSVPSAGVPEDLPRVRGALSAFHAVRREAVAAVPGDPTGTVVRHWEGTDVVATASPGSALGWVQRVVGVGPDDHGVVDEVAAWFVDLHVPVWEAEVIPAGGDVRPLSAALARHGLLPSRHLDVLAGPVPPPPVSAPGGVVVTDVESGDGDRFAGVLLDGFGDSRGPGGAEHSAIARWPSLPSMRCCVAELAGETVGAAALMLDRGVALLANAAVLPAARQQGVHGALLAHRIDAARRAGVDFLAAAAQRGGPSHRNQRRAGLAVAATLAIWTSAPAGLPPPPNIG